MLGQRIKSSLKAIPIVTVAMYIAHDLKQGLHLALGQIATESGSTHLRRSESESLSYIEEVFSDYKTYGGIEKFSGVVAEIGPGDSAGVAMLMRYDGCDRVDLIDRYYSHRNLEQQSNLYEALAQKYQLHYLKQQRIGMSNPCQALPGKLVRQPKFILKPVGKSEGKSTTLLYPVRF
jgi:hypothetical protein